MRGNEGHLAQVELVRDAVHHDGAHAGVAEDDLLAAVRGGVALKGGLGVLQEQVLKTRQLGQELRGDLGCLRVGGLVGEAHVVVEQRAADLLAQDALDAQQPL